MRMALPEFLPVRPHFFMEVIFRAALRQVIENYGL